MPPMTIIVASNGPSARLNGCQSQRRHGSAAGLHRRRLLPRPEIGGSAASLLH